MAVSFSSSLTLNTVLLVLNFCNIVLSQNETEALPTFGDMVQILGAVCNRSNKSSVEESNTTSDGAHRPGFQRRIGSRPFLSVSIFSEFPLLFSALA